jgi:RHS repeat-associated protein
MIRHLLFLIAFVSFLSANTPSLTTYHYDGLGSARYLSDETGTFTDSYDYEAFGKLLNREGNTTNHYLYTGEQLDEESRQYYLRARYYAPTTGRFTQMDTYMGSSADPLSLHKYLYANANPVMYTDPSGHFSMMGMSMAMNIRETLQDMQFATYSKSVDLVLGLINGVKHDSATDFISIPALAGTAVGLRLMLRFSPRLQRACRNSFTAGTLVAAANGLIPIEDINIGDKVWAYNETNQTKSLQEVTHLIRGEGNKTLTDITLSSGEIITATSNHPFWAVADHNWTEAGELTLDNILLNINEYNTTISNLKTYTKEDVVYNLTVANEHTYFVGSEGVLGHNAGCHAPGNDTWDHIYNPYIKNRKIKGLHHAPAGLLPHNVIPIKKLREKHGFYELQFNMPSVGSSGRRGKNFTTMFPDSWSPRMVRSVINRAYILAKKRGTGDMQIPLNDIIGDNRYGGISIMIHMRGNTRQPFAYPIIGGI